MGELAPTSNTPTVTRTTTPTPTKPSTTISSTSTPVATTSTTLSTSTSKSSTIASSTTSAGNGVQTPQPTQPDMVANCAKFYWVAQGVSCSEVLRSQGITLQDLFQWNPSVKSDCSGLWAEVNVCVGIVGGSTPTQTPSPTTPSNGIQTPQPTQPGMVTNCNKFYWM